MDYWPVLRMDLPELIQINPKDVMKKISKSKGIKKADRVNPMGENTCKQCI